MITMLRWTNIMKYARAGAVTSKPTGKEPPQTTKSLPFALSNNADIPLSANSARRATNAMHNIYFTWEISNTMTKGPIK